MARCYHGGGGRDSTHKLLRCAPREMRRVLVEFIGRDLFVGSPVGDASQRISMAAVVPPSVPGAI